MKSVLAKVQIFRFWPKTMDYNKAFWPKLGSFFIVLLLQNGRCYEAEICAILLLLRCPFQWYPCLPKSDCSVFGQKPWTIIRRFDQILSTLITPHWKVLSSSIKYCKIMTGYKRSTPPPPPPHTQSRGGGGADEIGLAVRQRGSLLSPGRYPWQPGRRRYRSRLWPRLPSLPRRSVYLSKLSGYPSNP